MCPTIVERPGAARPLLALGSPARSRIVSAVVQTILNAVDFGMEPQEAVDAPASTTSGSPTCSTTSRARSPPTERTLRARGHVLETKTYT